MDRAIRPSATHQILEAQHGVIARTQALASGMSESMVSRRLKQGVWQRAAPGVYRLAGMRPTWKQELMAACLTSNGVVSHRSAAALWGLSGTARNVVEVTALRHRRTQAPGIVCHESQTLFAPDVTEIDGVPVTMPTRTIVDLAVVLPENEVETALDDALRRSLTSVPRIRTLLDVLGPYRPGNTRMNRVLDRRPRMGTVPESYLETRFVQLVREAGLPEPERQVRIETAGRVAFLDFAYRDERLAVEVDGYEGHGGRPAWQAGLERMNRISDVGWQVLHFSSTDIEKRPDRVIAQVRSALSSRAA